MTINCRAFKEGEIIPQKYTCDGINISPPLTWAFIPVNTLSFLLICEDPDAVLSPFIHWLYYNIPVELMELPENIPSVSKPETGGEQGLNDFHKVGYSGPCPPRGTHRYFFRLYALDTVLDLPAGNDKQAVFKAMKGHVLAEASLMGHFNR